MKVTIDTYAWFARSDLSVAALMKMKDDLTVIPRRSPEYDDGSTEPILMYKEEGDRFGVARDYYFQKARQQNEIEDRTTKGRRDLWGGTIAFGASLREEQEAAVSTIVQRFKVAGLYGGLLQAAPGWGKTVASCALISRMDCPTLVVVHKEFLMNQWRDRIQQFLPGAKIGFAQQDNCDFVGKHVVLAMVHSVAAKAYPSAFYEWPGLVITDECHRIGAATWSPVPALFPARWRLGITATPRRKDGADKVFFYHLGRRLFIAKEQRMKPKIKKLYTGFKLVKTPRFNPNLAPRTLIINFLTKSDIRNKQIIDQLILALKAGRKVLVLSERLQHLKDMDALLGQHWPAAEGRKPSSGYYVGGMSEAQLDRAKPSRVIFATVQYAQEGLDIPALDTLFLTTPISDVEQAVGRILRPCDGKKEPIVVDFVDRLVPMFARMEESRDKIYARMT
jgi:superfamily II DNA or RNA helicase